ncbi:phytase [Nonomuraea soli]|uniref:3-phytase n=1 Tax=Nonomuraea soli TaxID=1032476 RepID=A0A7W0CFY3_9ACTN|nr:phytase [Nonomuraea soli]MBA2890472.1 3-phytase [Nonomuraea soli]
MRTLLAAALTVTALTAVPAATHADPLPSATPAVETPALFDDEKGGNANGDDPAIWVNPADDAKSLVIATAKEGGLYVYDLDGRQLQHIPAPPAPGGDDEPGRFNNVDLVHRFGGRDLAVVSDRGRDQLRFYAIDPATRALTDVTDPAVPYLFNTTQAQVNEAETGYGVAAWQDRTGTYALVSRRHDTRLGLFKLIVSGGKVSYRRVRTLDLPASFTMPDGTTWTPCGEPGEKAQVEGMVVDQGRDVLYAAQEDVGIWRLKADLTGKPELIDTVREYGRQDTFDAGTEECLPGQDRGFGGTRLSADAEGLTIWYGKGGTGYLLASSQGDNTFAVYTREGRNRHLGSFTVGAGTGVDAVQHSDGAMVVNQPVGRFKHGLLVVHDGENTPADGERENTNFKFVPWERVPLPAR